MPVYNNISVNSLVIFLSNLASETSSYIILNILFHDMKKYICQIIFPNKLLFFISLRSNLSVFKKLDSTKQFSYVKMYLFKI